MTRPTKRQLEQRVVRAAMRNAEQVSRDLLGYVALKECASHFIGTDRDVLLACAALRAKGKR